MAARRKKRKAARRGRSAKVNVVVGSKVKESIKKQGVRCSGDLVDALNDHVQATLKSAVARCKANRRGTVRPQDL